MKCTVFIQDSVAHIQTFRFLANDVSDCKHFLGYKIVIISSGPYKVIHFHLEALHFF